MAKMIQQYIYRGDESESALKLALVNGNAFDYGADGRILALGIQTVPGIKFNLNGNSIYVGPSGIYEIDYSDNCEIKSLSFDGNTLNLIDNEIGNYLIIDIMYDNGG